MTVLIKDGRAREKLEGERCRFLLTEVSSSLTAAWRAARPSPRFRKQSIKETANVSRQAEGILTMGSVVITSRTWLIHLQRNGSQRAAGWFLNASARRFRERFEENEIEQDLRRIPELPLA